MPASSTCFNRLKSPMCAGAIIGVLFGVLLFLYAPKAEAAAGVNQQLNFQGRLLDSAGAVIADGDYHMEFEIVQDGDGCNPTSGSYPCSGTVKWTETWTGGNLIRVKNGYFNVQLGSLTAFGSSVDWNQDTLWLSINIGGTGGSPSWDGEMKPLKRLTSTPYAFNALNLGGLAASSYVQLAQGLQADASAANASIAINKTGGTANILTLQRSGADVLTINNSGLSTFFSDVDYSLAGAENVLLSSNTGTASTDVLSLLLTNSDTGAGTQRGLVLTMANDAANATTEAGLVINNLETTANSVTDYILVTTASADSNTDAIDVSDDDLFNAINLGTNFLVSSGDSINDFSGNGLLVSSNAVIVDQNFSFNWTADHTWSLSGAEDLAVSHDLAGTVNVISVTGTPNSSANTAYGIYIDQADSANAHGLDAALVIDNSDVTGAVIADGILFVNAGSGFTRGITLAGATTDVTTAGNEDLTVSPGGTGTLTFSTANTTASALDINATAGGIDIDASGSIIAISNASNSAADDVIIEVTGSNDASVVINSSGTNAADAIDLNATAGGITIDALTSMSFDVTSATAASNISVAANADSEDLTLAVTGSAGDLILSSADQLTLDGVLLSLDGTTSSNLTVTGSGQNLTVNVAGGGAQVLSLASAGTGANALDLAATGTGGGVTINTTDGAISLTAAGATNGDVTISPTDDFNLNGTAGSLINLGTSIVAQTITIGAASSTDLALNDANWSVGGAGTANFADLVCSSATCISSSEISDATITGDDVASSIAGNGLVLTAGSPDVLDVGAGNGISVAANAVAIQLLDAVDSTGSVSSQSGLEFGDSGSNELTLLQGCSDLEVLKWVEATDLWTCGADNSSSAPFNSLAGVITKATAGDRISLEYGDLGDVQLEISNVSAGSPITADAMQVLLTGGSGIVTDNVDGLYVNIEGANGTSTDVSALHLDFDPISGSADDTFSGLLVDGITGTSATENAINIGSGWDTALSVAGTQIFNGSGQLTALTSGDGAGATSSGSGMETGTGGVGLLQGCSDDQILKWNESSAIWECGSDRATYSTTLSGDYTNNTTTFTDVDDNATGNSDMAFPIGSNEDWVFIMNVQHNSPAAADSKWQITAPAGATCDFSAWIHNVSTSNLGCSASSGNLATAGAADASRMSGLVRNGGTSGNVQLQFGQNAASGTSTIYAGSWVLAWKISGADLAEFYNTNESNLTSGMVATLDPSLSAGVKATTRPYDRQVVGVISTQPGMVLGNSVDAGLGGRSVPLALSGRVPVKVTTENGSIMPGDLLTSSSTPGVAMRATKAGAIIGQAMTGFSGEGIGNITVFLKTSYSLGSGTSELANGLDTANSEFAKNILSKLMTKNEELLIETDMSEIVTDRLVAGLEIITPQVTADKIALNTIEAASAEQINVNGDIVINGTLYADKIKASQIEGLEVLASSIGSLPPTASHESSQENPGVVAGANIDLNDLKVQKARVSLDLSVDGLLSANGGLVVEGPAQFNGESIFEKLVTFENKSLFKGDSEFRGRATFNNDSGGFAKIKDGEQEVAVTFERPFEHLPIVTLSVKNGQFVQYAYKDLSDTGFTIILKEPAMADIEFSWTALSVKNARTSQN